MYDSIFHVMDSSRQQEYDSSVSGLGQLVENSAAQPVTYESLIQGYNENYVHKIYQKGFKVERELVDDDQYNIISRGPKALATAAVRTVENTAGNIFDNAFSSGTGGDAKYLCDTQHPRLDGGKLHYRLNNLLLLLHNCSSKLPLNNMGNL